MVRYDKRNSSITLVRKTAAPVKSNVFTIAYHIMKKIASNRESAYGPLRDDDDRLLIHYDEQVEI